MVKLIMSSPKNLKRTKNSIYIHSEVGEVYNILEDLPPKSRTWTETGWGYCYEVAERHFKTVMQMLSPYDLEIFGDLTEEAESYLEKLDKFESLSSSDYVPKTEPRAHQWEALEYAQHKPKFILGDQPGLGKTKVAIDSALSRKHQFKHCLIIVCVNGLKWNWVREIQTHSDEQARILGERTTKTGRKVVGSMKSRLDDLINGRDEFFLITNVETLRDKDITKEISRLCDEGIIGMVVVDEMHLCKNPSSLQGKAIQEIRSYYKLALTGTPLMNAPVDLYAILKWLEVEHKSYSQFKSFYCVFGGYGGHSIVGYRHIDKLQQKLSSVMLRRLKKDVLDLPPKIQTTEYVEMSSKQAKLYDDITKQLSEDVDKILLHPNPLVELTRLRQCTGYPGILSTTVTESPKFDRAEELIKEAVDNGGKVIVFSNWTSIIDPLYNRLRRYNPARITGKTKDRPEQEQMFQTDDTCKVILGTIAAMGTGLTLTSANTVIFIDSPWNRANKDQAEDRAHRIGTTDTVNVITLVAKDTIDEKIEALIKDKGQTSDLLVDNASHQSIDSELLGFLLNKGEKS